MYKDLRRIKFTSTSNFSVARIETRSRASVRKFERHIERKNESYENMNVDLSQTDRNVHFKSCGDKTYNEHLDKMIENGAVSLRGLKPDATVFDEMILDVNSNYFQSEGGYDFSCKFYEEAFHFAEKIYGKENIISAVMHADELNTALSEQYGKPIYHYHLHVMALPVVEKEIRWSKRCKDKELIGTVKEVVHQISHSKKWKSSKMIDENGNSVFNSNGKPIYHSSYSILQDEFYDYMQNACFDGFNRGEKGSTAENLTSLDYKIKQDQNRLKEIQNELKYEKVHQETSQHISMMSDEIDRAGKKTLTGKYTVDAENYEKITAFAHEGVSSRGEIARLERKNKRLRERNWDLQSRINRLEAKLNELEEKCAGFLIALKIAPQKVKAFIDDVVKQFKEQQKSIFYEPKKKKDKER